MQEPVFNNCSCQAFKKSWEMFPEICSNLEIVHLPGYVSCFCALCRSSEMISEESCWWCCFIKLNLGCTELLQELDICGRNRLKLKHLFVLQYNNCTANRNFWAGRECQLELAPSSQCGLHSLPGLSQVSMSLTSLSMVFVQLCRKRGERGTRRRGSKQRTKL